MFKLLTETDQSEQTKRGKVLPFRDVPFSFRGIEGALRRAILPNDAVRRRIGSAARLLVAVEGEEEAKSECGSYGAENRGCGD